MFGFDARVKAVLGPTNTGKTHLAIERLLAHASGIIGFPLRLLARRHDQHTLLIFAEEALNESRRVPVVHGCFHRQTGGA